MSICLKVQQIATDDFVHATPRYQIVSIRGNAIWPLHVALMCCNPLISNTFPHQKQKTHFLLMFAQLIFFKISITTGFK